MLQHLVGPVRRPEVLRGQSVTEVPGQIGAEFGELPVRIAVQAADFIADRGDDCLPHLVRDTVSVLVDVQEDGDVQLGGTVRMLPPEIVA